MCDLVNTHDVNPIQIYPNIIKGYTASLSFPYVRIDKSISQYSLISEVLGLIKEDNIIIPDENTVKEYLYQHPSLVDVVSIACHSATQKFNNSELTLELYHDPENNDEFLVLFVRQPEYQENIFGSIESIRNDYQDRLVNSSGYFLLTTDFQKPKYKNGI